MKTLIVYYSLEGNTDYVIKKLASKINADVLRLIPKKEYPTGGFKKFIWGGKSVVFGEKPKLEEYQVSLNEYDKVIIGTPIWASSFTPPIKTFLSDNIIEGKKIYLAACHAGGGAEKCFQKLKEELNGANQLIDYVDFCDPKAKPDNINEQKIIAFADKINHTK